MDNQYIISPEFGLAIFFCIVYTTTDLLTRGYYVLFKPILLYIYRLFFGKLNNRRSVNAVDDDD